MKITTSVAEIQRHIKTVLQGCPGGMDEDSLKAACLVQAEIQDLQATLKLLQQCQITGSVDASGEVVLSSVD